VAFADIATNTDINVKVFVKVSPVDVTTGTATDLYFAYGEMSTDKIDGTLLEFEGRLRGALRVNKLDQRIGGGAYQHPTASFSFHVGDEDDDIWDYFGDDYHWEGGDCKVWLVDLEQDWTDSTDNGRRLQIDGKVTRGPSRLEINSTLRLDVRDTRFDDYLPAQLIANASESACGFIQPVICNLSSGGILFLAIAPTTTTVIPADNPSPAGTRDVSEFGYGQVVFCCDITTGASPEQMFVTDVTTTPGSESITVVRGYNGTTAVTHAAGSVLYAMQPGPNTRINTVDRNGLYVPYVFAAGLVDRNPYLNLTPYMIARETRTYGAPTAANVECYLSMGKGPDIPTGKAFDSIGGASIGLGVDATFNDEDSVNGTSVAWGTAIGVGAQFHLQPHIELAGTYVEMGRAVTAIAPTDIYWALIRGLTVDETTGGNVIRWPCGIMLYLIQNASYGFGETLADVVYADRITDYNAGDWYDEFAVGGDEAWWAQIAATVPAWGGSDPVKMMDFFQDLADLGLSDVWLRDGLLYPKRRAVAVTADWTILKSDPLLRPARVKDPHDVYCNRLTVSFAQVLLCEPLTGTPGVPPIPVPYDMTFEDQDEIAVRGLVEKVRQHAHCYCNFATTWISDFATNAEPQTAHLEWWDAANQAAFAQRAQPQLWMEVTLPERFAAIEQGETIKFDVAPHTTRKGQVRQVDLTTDDTGRVAQVKVRSWHIDF